MEVSGQLYPQGKSPWYPLDRRLGGPQNHSGCGGLEKNSQPLPGIKLQNPECPAHERKLTKKCFHENIPGIIRKFLILKTMTIKKC
jgi:hypothetical protein